MRSAESDHVTICKGLLLDKMFEIDDVVDVVCGYYDISHDYLLYVLIFHIIISVITLILWIKTLVAAKRYKRLSTLPGLYSQAHKKDGQWTFIGIILTMLTGAWVYALLFVY